MPRFKPANAVKPISAPGFFESPWTGVDSLFSCSTALIFPVVLASPCRWKSGTDDMEGEDVAEGRLDDEDDTGHT